MELEKLAGMQASDEEIAAFFSVSPRTIYRRKKVKRFSEAIERGKAKGRLSIRRHQLKILEAGNPAMGIWLGKQHLGQTDHLVHEVTGQSIYVLVPGASFVEASQPEPAALNDGFVIDVSRIDAGEE